MEMRNKKFTVNTHDTNRIFFLTDLGVHEPLQSATWIWRFAFACQTVLCLGFACFFLSRFFFFFFFALLFFTCGLQLLLPERPTDSRNPEHPEVCKKNSHTTQFLLKKTFFFFFSFCPKRTDSNSLADILVSLSLVRSS